jgi:cytochrome oxidase Cu insertion factor (SCO1/SenC/PrrC family)
MKPPVPSAVMTLFLVLAPLQAQETKKRDQPQTAADNPNLAIGKMAPEITGDDIDGKPFKLSDFRGKVVLLDFWGNW